VVMRVPMGVAVRVARRVIVVLVGRHVRNISAPHAVHYFKACFAASRRRWALQPFARRVGSPLPPMLRCP
jgi:hypothetical protein